MDFLVDSVRVDKLDRLCRVIVVNAGKRYYTEEFIEHRDLRRLIEEAALARMADRAISSLFSSTQRTQDEHPRLKAPKKFDFVVCPACETKCLVRKSKRAKRGRCSTCFWPLEYVPGGASSSSPAAKAGEIPERPIEAPVQITAEASPHDQEPEPPYAERAEFVSEDQISVVLTDEDLVKAGPMKAAGLLGRLQTLEPEKPAVAQAVAIESQVQPLLLRCPHCRRMLQAPADARGKFICCPACKGEFVVPRG